MEWIINGFDYDQDRVYECPVCGAKEKEQSNYCPNCGTYLGGKDDKQ